MKEIIFLFGVFLASGGLCCLKNAQPGFRKDDDDRESLSSPMAIRKGCNTTADCGHTEYCGGSGVPKSCINCFDCKEVKRKQRTNYEGPTCATHPTDCAQCYDGYEEYAGLCVNKTSFTSTILMVETNQVPNPNEEARESKTSTILPIAGAIIVAAFVFSIILWGAHQRHSKQGVGFRNEEERVLTNSNRAFEESPTAPPPPSQQPEEYRRPPPIYVPTPLRRSNGNAIVDDCGPHKAKRPRWGENRFRVNERRRGALPFSLGNVASNIIVSYMAYSDDEEVGGGVPAILPHPGNQETGAELRTGWEGNVRTAATPGAAAAVPRARTPNLPSQQAYAPPNPLPSQPTARAHASAQHGDTPPNFVNDPFHRYVRFAFEMNLAQISNHNPNPSHPPAPQHPLRNVVSAPPSPLGVDDTHLNWDMREIQSFASPPSVASIDSGTASSSNDNHNEVPSRSVSRADIHGLSDTEMSMFDFDGIEEDP